MVQYRDDVHGTANVTIGKSDGSYIIRYMFLGNRMPCTTTITKVDNRINIEYKIGTDRSMTFTEIDNGRVGVNVNEVGRKAGVLFGNDIPQVPILLGACNVLLTLTTSKQMKDTGIDACKIITTCINYIQHLIIINVEKGVLPLH